MEPKGLYRVHKSRLVDPTLSQVTIVLNFTLHFQKIYFNRGLKKSSSFKLHY